MPEQSPRQAPGRRKPKIFIGLDEIADYTLCLADGMRANGYEVTNTIFELTNPLWKQNNPHYTRVVRHSNMLVTSYDLSREFVRVLDHDVFVFSFAGSFTSRAVQSRWLRRFAYMDLPLLRRLRKKIVFTTHGSDIRSAPLYERDVIAAGFEYVYTRELTPEVAADDSLKRLRAANINRYADVVFSQPFYSHLLTKEPEHLWLPVILERYEFRNTGGEEPLIVHAPSSRVHKGTKYVLDAVERLRSDGARFRFQLCENMRNDEVRRLLTDADIVIDQLEPMHGLLTLEAMASGCAVVGGARPGYVFPKELPVVTTTPSALADDLGRLIAGPQVRIDLAHRGRAYVEQYHDHREVARRFLRTIGLEVPGIADRSLSGGAA